MCLFNLIYFNVTYALVLNVLELNFKTQETYILKSVSSGIKRGLNDGVICIILIKINFTKKSKLTLRFQKLNLANNIIIYIS